MKEIEINATTETLIVLGGPGSGKDTQVDFLVKALGYQEISSGQLVRLRAECDEGLRKVLEKGGLVPSDVVDDEIISVFALLPDNQPVIINGYPRTRGQAEKLEIILRENNRRIDRVLYIRVDDKELIKRISKRRVCASCGYFTDNSHQKCPECGGVLKNRKDDFPASVKRRLEIFHKETEPVFDFYRARGVLVEVDGNPPIERVRENIKRVL